jgi:hypothetical protein
MLFLIKKCYMYLYFYKWRFTNWYGASCEAPRQFNIKISQNKFQYIETKMAFHLQLNPTHWNSPTNRISLTNRMYYRFHLYLNSGHRNPLTTRIYYSSNLLLAGSPSPSRPCGYWPSFLGQPWPEARMA